MNSSGDCVYGHLRVTVKAFAVSKKRLNKKQLGSHE
jgi:hypothetical protein